MSRACLLAPELAAPDRLAFLNALIEATAPRDVAAAIEQLICWESGCDDVRLLWSEESPGGFQTSATVPPSPADVRSAQAVLDGAAPWLVAGSRLSLRLLAGERAVLLLRLSPEQSPAAVLALIEPCLQPISRHLQRAVQLARLVDSHRQLERSETLQRALFAISDLAGSELDMPDMLRGIHAIISTLMYAENFFIARHHIERGTMQFLYFVDIEDEDYPDITAEYLMEERRHSATWHLLTGGKTLMGSTALLRQQVDGPLKIVGMDGMDWLGVPMLRNGQVHGALVVQSYSEEINFSEDDRTLLEFVGSHVLTALERKQGKEELEQRVRTRTLELADANLGLQQEVQERERAERLQAALFHVAQLATADIVETEFYERMHAVVGKLLNAENFYIALLSDDRQTLLFPYLMDAGVRRTAERPVTNGLLSECVLRNGLPMLVSSANVVEMGERGEIDLQGIGALAECWLGVPLQFAGETFGLVVVQSYTPNVGYDAADQELLSFVALQIANSIQRRRSAASLHLANAELEQRVEERTLELRQQIAQREQVQDQLKHQVMHDALTGLPNRRFMRDRVERVLGILQREPDRRCALLYLDMDRFKVINDSLGHLAGDDFLREVAVRLQNCVRDPDVVARLSGDEFAILLEDVELPGTAVTVAKRILEALGQPLQIAGRELIPSASIGIVVGDDRYQNVDELFHDADTALYRAKKHGRKRFELFDETLAQNVVDVLAMEGEIRHGLAHDEFEPYMQPVCRLAGGAVVGYEALVRWNHPLHGVLSPAAFLRVAEDCGFIEAMDWRIFELGCRQLAQLSNPDTYLTINVSALHLRHPNFDERLVQMLERVGLPANRLIVEVTEGSLLENPDMVRATLERLRAIGIGAALDDFGTGYSSLSYLHSLPLRVLKIDRAFVQALDAGVHNTTTTVVAAILAMASALNIEVIAEGIETEAQLRALQNMGCEFGQGYLLGRPAPVEHWLEQSV